MKVKINFENNIPQPVMPVLINPCPHCGSNPLYKRSDCGDIHLGCCDLKTRCIDTFTRDEAISLATEWNAQTLDEVWTEIACAKFNLEMEICFL